MKRILAISLLFIFLAGQFNLTWGTHFCGQFAVERSVSFGEDHLSCGMEEDRCCDEDESEHSGPIVLGEDCCSNDFYSSDADDFFFKTEGEQKTQLQFESAYTLSYYNPFQEAENKYSRTKNNCLLIPTDRQVLHQTFLL